MRIYQGCLDPTLGELWEVDSFVPTDAAGCQFWYDGSMLNPVLDVGGKAASVYDFSGNNRHITEATTSKQPSIITSGVGIVLRGNGTTTTIQSTSWSGVQPVEVYVLAKPTSAPASSAYIIDGIDAIASLALYVPTGTTTDVRATSTGADLTRTLNILATWHVFRYLASGASSSFAVDLGAVTTGNAGSSAYGGVTLFSYATRVGGFFAGDIGAVVGYSAGLSNVTSQRVVNYLRRVALKLGQVVTL